MTTTTMSKVSETGTFEVAEVYKNRDGEYMVTAMIDGHECGHVDTLVVEYVDGKHIGKVTTLDIKGQTKVIKNMLREHMELFPVERGMIFRTLGRIARYGKLDASVPFHSRDYFLTKYREATDVRLNAGTDFYVYPEDNKTWGPGLTVTMPMPEGDESVDFGCSATVHNIGNMLMVSCNEFWWRLIGMGFRLGSVQDVDAIRANIPSQYHADFDAGLACVSEAVEAMAA